MITRVVLEGMELISSENMWKHSLCWNVIGSTLSMKSVTDSNIESFVWVSMLNKTELLIFQRRTLDSWRLDSSQSLKSEKHFDGLLSFMGKLLRQCLSYIYVLNWNTVQYRLEQWNWNTFCIWMLSKQYSMLSPVNVINYQRFCAFCTDVILQMSKRFSHKSLTSPTLLPQFIVTWDHLRRKM